MDRNAIGKKIEKLRKECGMSQARLANEAGLSPSYIPDLEKGLKCPTVETLDNICYALNITLCEFFTETNEGASQNKVDMLSEHQKKLLNDFLHSL